MIIYLVRHADAKSGWDLSDREKLSLGLTDFGQTEAEATANYLKDKNIKKIFSSPIERAKETAQIIGSRLKLSVSYDDRLKEFSLDFDLKDKDKLKELKFLSRENPESIMPSGESLSGAIGRLVEALKDFGKGNYNSICVVSHRVIIERFLATLFNIRPNEYEWIRNASVTELDLKNDIFTLNSIDKRYRNFKLLFMTFKRYLGFY